jgi:hypothetical protein
VRRRRHRQRDLRLRQDLHHQRYEFIAIPNAGRNDLLVTAVVTHSPAHLPDTAFDGGVSDNRLPDVLG